MRLWCSDIANILYYAWDLVENFLEYEESICDVWLLSCCETSKDSEESLLSFLVDFVGILKH